MLLADVNLFIHAHRPESPRFAEHHAWLTAALTADEPFGVSELILSGFLRIVTNHRVYREPTPPQVALDFCQVERPVGGPHPPRAGALAHLREPVPEPRGAWQRGSRRLSGGHGH